MTPKTQKLSFLIVDDEDTFGRRFQKWLEDLGYQAALARTFEEAREKIRHHEYDGVVVDYYLPPSNGLELLQAIREEKPDLPVILITGVERTIGRQALQQGAFWYLEKPIDLTEARVIFEYLAERKRLLDIALRRQQKAEALASAALTALSHALLSAQNVDDLLQTVIQKAPAFLGAEDVRIALLDPATGQLQDRSPEARQEEGEPETGEPSAVSPEFLEKIAEDLLRSLETSEDVPERGGPDEHGGYLRARLCLAPQPREEQEPEDEQKLIPYPLAVVVAYYSASPPPEADSRLDVLARLVGAAIAHHRQRRLFQALGGAAKDILAASSREALYPAVEKALKDVFEVSTYYLALSDHEKQRIVFPIFVSERKALDPPPTLPLPPDPQSGLTGYILSKAEEWECVKWRGQPCVAPEGYQVQREGRETLAFLGIPLIVEDRKVGVLSIQRHAPVPFLEATREALRTLGALIALALDRLAQEESHWNFLKGIFDQPLQKALDHLARRTQKALGADIVTLHVYDAQHEMFRPERVRLGLPDQEAGKKRSCEPENDDVLMRLLHTEAGEHFAVDAAHDEVFKGEFVDKYHVQSSGGVVLTLPVEGSEEVPVGVLMVNYKKRHEFTHEETKSLRQLGQDAALAIEAALLVDREQQARKRLALQETALQKIGAIQQKAQQEGGSQAEFREDLAKGVVETLREAWPKVGCVEVTPSILYADYGARVLRFPEKIRDQYHIDVPEERERKHIAFGDGICGWVAEHRQTYYAPDVHQDDVYLKLIESTRSEIAVPILLGDRLLGVLDVEANAPSFFTVEDQIFLERLAKELGTVLGAWGEKERAKRILRSAHEAAAQPGRALDVLVKGAFELVDEPQGSVTAVVLFSRSGDSLTLSAVYPPKQDQDNKTCCPSFPLTSTGTPRGVVVRAAREKSTQLVPKVHDDPDYYPCHKDTVAEMAVPFFDNQGEVIGVLNVEYNNASAMDAQDRQLLESLAAQTPIILALQEKSRALRKTSEQRRLSAALAVLGIAAADYGHQWKNELAAFRGTVGLIKEELWPFCQQPHPSLRARLARRLGLLPDFEDVCRWLKRVQAIMQAPPHTDFPAPDEDIEDIEVVGWLKEIQKRWAQRLQHRETKVVLEVQSEPSGPITHVRGNRRWLTRAVDNLVSNAVRAAIEAARQEGRKPRVILKAEQQGEHVLIYVRDNGLGIPEEIRPYLFQGRVPRQQARGHGTGGLITAFVAQFYGGTVRIKQTDKSGTEILMEIPRTKQGNDEVIK